MKIRQWFGGRVIADNRDDFAVQVSGAAPVEQVRKTVGIGGSQNGYLGAMVRHCQVVLDVERFGQRLEVVVEVRDRNIEPFQIPFQPR